MPLASVYGGLIRIRASLYRHGLLSSAGLGSPAISVGNLTVGGTGKTPLVGYLARRFLEEGFQAVVLSRGYKGSFEKSNLIVSDGQRIFCGPRDCGDEPYLLAETVRGVAVVVGRDRRRSAALAKERFERPVFLLDDAFQHLRVKRDLDLLVLDATDPFGGGKVLPRGRLREPLSAAMRADWIVLTRSHLASDLESTRKEIGLLCPGLPISSFYHRPEELIEVRDGGAHSLESLTGKRSIAVSGIANPETFLKDLERAGMNAVARYWYRDHHWYSARDLARILAAADENGAETILTTEKDAVRLRGLDLPAGRIFALRIRVDSEAPEALWTRMLEVAGRG